MAYTALHPTPIFHSLIGVQPGLGDSANLGYMEVSRFVRLQDSEDGKL